MHVKNAKGEELIWTIDLKKVCRRNRTSPSVIEPLDTTMRCSWGQCVDAQTPTLAVKVSTACGALSSDSPVTTLYTRMTGGAVSAQA